MTEEYRKKYFMKELDLVALNPFNASSKILEKSEYASSIQYSSLSEKNNNVVTGYENFCIKHKSRRLYPFVDFDFHDKNVVCQKCFNKFVSKKSYKEHIDTVICKKIHSKPNEVYLNYKKRNSHKSERKNMFMEDYVHNIRRMLLNPDMVNTLQTRNNCYSNKVHQRSTNNNKRTVKKPKGKLGKNTKKQGRAEKLSLMTVNSTSETDNGLNNNLESHETELTEPSKAHCSEVLQALFSSTSTVTNYFRKIFRSASSTSGLDNSEKSEENFTLQLIKEVYPFVKVLEKEYITLFEQSKNHEMQECYEKAKHMLLTLKEICVECEKFLSKFDVNNESTTDEGKENINLLVKIRRVIKKIDFDKFENWFNSGKKDTSSTTSMDYCDL